MSGNIQVDPISSQMLQAVGRAAFLYFLLRGVLALGFGLFAVLAPTGTIHAIVVAFGLFAILDGIIALVSSFLLRGLNWNWLVTSGLLGIAFGVVCLRWPETTVYASLLLIAAWALASGALQAVGSFALKSAGDSGWFWSLIAGIVVASLGVVILFNPTSAVKTVMILLGIWAIVHGVFQLVNALNVRRLPQRVFEA